jgi:hypothetical protein
MPDRQFLVGMPDCQLCLYFLTLFFLSLSLNPTSLPLLTVFLLSLSPLILLPSQPSLYFYYLSLS